MDSPAGASDSPRPAMPAVTPAVLRTLSAALMLAAAVRTQAAELRGVWVARDGLTSRAKIVQTLDQLAAANINVVCVNCWSRGYTIHPSDVLFAACGQRQDPSYLGRDPLHEFVVEAHLRGIEVEAWFEYGFIFGWSGWFAGPAGTGPVLGANPAWVARDNLGNSQFSDGAGGYYTWAIHEHPAVRQFLIDLAVEVVDRYDIDGIQFDRVRYPSTSFGYDATTTAAYQLATGQSPPGNPNNNAWKRWRADRLSAFHQDLYRAVKARRPTVRVTNAPIVVPTSYDSYLQDWPAWVTGGAIDLVYPQVYRTTLSQYVASLDQQLAAVPSGLRSRIVPGIRAISGTPTSEVLAMVGANRSRSLSGHVFWYAEGLYDDLPALTSNYFQGPAVVPQRPANWRPTAVVREENDPTTTVTGGFLPGSPSGASGGQARLALSSAAASDRVVYTLPVAETGLWSLLVSAPGGAGMSARAPHYIATAAGPVQLHVDQTLPGAAWRELGSMWLAAGTATVEVRAVPGEAVIADAVALLRSRWPSGPMDSYGAGTTGSLGGLQLAAWERCGLGGTLRLQGSRIPAGTPAWFGIGFASAATPLFGGTVLVAPDLSVFAVADAAGLVDTAIAVPFVPRWLGTQLFVQGLALDANGPAGVSLSAAVRAVVQ